MAILKPNTSSATAILNTVGGDISANSSTNFTLKLTSMDMNVQTPMMDATPEPLDDENDPSGTSFPALRLRHKGKTTGTVRMSGLVIAGKTIGFGNLPAEDVDVFITIGKEETDSSPKIHSLKFRMAITDVRLKWARGGPGVPVEIVGQIHSGFGTTVVANTGEGITEVVSA